MIVLGVTIVIVIGIVSSIVSGCYFEFKAKELECQKEQDKYMAQTADNSLKLEFEKERTKQLEIKSNYRKEFGSTMSDEFSQLEIEREKTKQLEIKSNYRKEHDSALY